METQTHSHINTFKVPRRIQQLELGAISEHQFTHFIARIAISIDEDTERKNFLEEVNEHLKITKKYKNTSDLNTFWYEYAYVAAQYAQAKKDSLKKSYRILEKLLDLRRRLANLALGRG